MPVRKVNITSQIEFLSFTVTFKGTMVLNVKTVAIDQNFHVYNSTYAAYLVDLCALYVNCEENVNKYSY